MENLAPRHTIVFARVSGFSSDESRSLWWYVHDAGHWQCGIGYHVAPRTYHGHLIMFMVAGSGQGVYRDKSWRASKGDAVLMDLHHRHSYASDNTNPWEMFWVILDGPGVGQVFRALTQGAGSCVIPFASEKRMRADFTAVFQLLQDHPPGSEAWVWHHLTGLIANIWEGLRRVRGDSAASLGGVPEGIAAAIRFLQQEHHRAITLHELAKEARMSLYHFARRFRETTGFTPMEYLEKYRIRRGQELLLNRPELRLGEIAQAVGYEDPAYFSRVFRKRVGVSAREYRRRVGVQPS